ncbi:hypothetical protein H9I45_00925 [Polaribacter haliotis]|uniref:Uncharacterized protein n=2 Tax=Polaribacter TaxID=52959 RepID=A0A7L8AG96_9FLAO|nr:MULTISPECIES: hypothetical protein [Polaribacter]MDD7914087.1 hypothetical protein [Polaribacter sp. MSW5]QOD61033.1 hypothetical protein H9I45_00925 [Polaribacter haliotis]
MSNFEYNKNRNLNDKELELLISKGQFVDFQSDFNTRYILNAFTKLRNFDRDEIKFRISETSLIQFMGIISSLLRKDPGLILSQENCNLFFSFGDYRNYEDFRFNCSNQDLHESQKEICEIIINNLIKSIVQEKLEKESSINFESNTWKKFENTNSIFSRSSILDYLENSLIYKINNWKGLKKENEILISQIVNLENNMDNNSFKLNILEEDLTKLYNVLKIDFINTETTKVEDFINVLLKPWNEHGSLIYLIMDHYQTYIFQKWFCKRYKVSLTLKDIEKSKLFKNTSGIKGFFTAGSISASQRRERTNDKKDEDQLMYKLLKSV